MACAFHNIEPGFQEKAFQSMFQKKKVEAVNLSKSWAYNWNSITSLIIYW